MNRVARTNASRLRLRGCAWSCYLHCRLASVAPSCVWAIEAVAERLDIKRQVFVELAELMPKNAGLATNSSHIRAASIAEGMDWAPRCMNMHFFHPVLVMDLVEVVASPLTGQEYVDGAVAWSRRIDRTPVVLLRDLDGFLVNRILGEASREAFALLAEESQRSATSTSLSRVALGGPLDRSSLLIYPVLMFSCSLAPIVSNVMGTRATLRP